MFSSPDHGRREVSQKVFPGLASITYEFMKGHVPELKDWPLAIYPSGDDFLIDACVEVSAATERLRKSIEQASHTPGERQEQFSAD